MHKFYSAFLTCTVALPFPNILITQRLLGADPRPLPGVEFILKSFDQYPAVGIGDLPGCEEAHNFIRSLIRNPIFPSKVDEIVVDFGNPLLQPLLDRYLLDSELVPRGLLRRVWDDTTRSVELTWDSPVYEQFFDAVRTVNVNLPRDKRIHVSLADSPIDWVILQKKEDLVSWVKRRSTTLADRVNSALAQRRHILVISFADQQFRAGIPNNARALIENANSGKFMSIIVQGRFGGAEVYRAVETGEASWELNTIAMVKDTWLGDVPVSSEPNAPPLQAAVDAILYVGPSDSLTILRPSAYVFQDEDYWTELNRRWRLVKDQPFNLVAAGFDLRSRFLDPLPFMPNMKAARRAGAPPPRSSSPPLKDEQVVKAADFVVQTIDRYPMIGFGDVHTCLEFHQFLHELVRDPRLPGKVNDIVVEFGNPLFQAAIDRYVLNGEDVPRDERKGAWENAAIGWSISSSPIYEYFFDLVREVNAKLPREKRMRVILGDAPLDFTQVRKDPATALAKFVISREAPLSAIREASLAASVHGVLAQGHRGLIICGSGHLRKNGLPGSARQLIDKQDPGKFYYLENVSTASSELPVGSVIVQGENAMLYIGQVEFQSSVRVSPLVFRDSAFWRDINLISQFTRNEWIDLARPEFEYRGRYFEAPWPEILRKVLGDNRK